MTKHELIKDMRVKTEWKGKVYLGVIMAIPQIAAAESAKITHGRFISIPILTDGGKIVQMPYTSRAIYEKG